MNRLSMSRITAGIIIVLLTGCQSRMVDRSVVEQAMSGRAGANIPGDKVRNAGEQAIPLIFDVVRDSADDMLPDRATLLIIGMTGMHTADSSAPYIRKILADWHEPERLRVLAAEMLSWYWESPQPQLAVISHAKSDISEAVRAQCIASLSGLTTANHARSKKWIVDQQVQQVFADALRDKSIKIREQACDCASAIAIAALYDGIELNWCEKLLVQGRQDKNYQVRRSAVDGLFVLESIRQKNRRANMGP